MAGNFIKCPRCELNYIDKTKQEYCDVCLSEMNLGPSLKFADLDDSELEDDTLELCPMCKTNYIKFNESICAECMNEKKLAKDDMEDEESEDWKDYLDDDVIDKDEDLTVDSTFEEEDELDEETDDFGQGEDDFDFDDEYDEDFDEDDLDDDDFDEYDD